METTKLALWHKIAYFNLDDPRATLPFSKKLMTEQKWSLVQTQRAIAEYKKFMFLVITEPYGASPSKMVDEVWHLHITFTKNYADFCEQVAPQFIHHHPSTGGSAEKSRHAAWYKDSLVAYIKNFDAPPPPDIWEYPSGFVPESFLPKNSSFLALYTEGGTLEKGENWSMDWNILLPFACCVLALILFFGNPFALEGPRFLTFYVILGLIGLGFTYFQESKMNKETLVDRKNSVPKNLSPLSLAWLMQGDNRFFQTALLQAIESKILLKAQGGSWTYNRFAPISELGNPIITTLQCLENGETNLANSNHRTQLFQEVMRPALSLTIRQLGSFKKVLFQPQKSHIITALVVAIGVARLFQGLATHHSIEFLVFAIIVIVLTKISITRGFRRNIAQFVTNTTTEDLKDVADNPVLSFAYGAPVPNTSMVLMSSFFLTEVMLMQMNMPKKPEDSSASSCGGSSSCGSDGGGSCGGGSCGGGGCGGGCGGCGG